MTNQDEQRAFSARKLLIGIGGTIVLGAIGSGLWEMLFRPGLGKIGNLVTSVSESAESFVYTTAALDPTPVPDLLVLLLIVQLPAIMAYLFIERGFIRRAIGRNIEKKIEKVERESANAPDPDAAVSKFIRKRVKTLSVIGAVYSLLFFALFFVAYSIENKAVVVWRVFHQNIEIISPHITEIEIRELHARFRSMKRHSDYQAIQQTVNKVAIKNNIELDWRDGR